MHVFATLTPEQLLEGGKRAYADATARVQSSPWVEVGDGTGR
jgi:hypothetical protein